MASFASSACSSEQALQSLRGALLGTPRLIGHVGWLLCLTVALVAAPWEKVPEGAVKDDSCSGSFPCGGLFYLFCGGERSACDGAKAAGCAARAVGVPQAP